MRRPHDARSPEQCPHPPSPCRYGTAAARPGGGTTLSPYDDRPFGELTELFRHDAGPGPRPRSPAAGHPVRPRPHHRGFAWLVPAAAAGSLTAGIALSHGLLLASGLVLAGLLGHLLAGDRDRPR
ncbi:hypothetical protein [Streptomyces decoyicus]|uniref:hypothetical protein n=1 Tax=Streptomyces decoyicus TaxID=249567 RepID=UPI0038655EC7|nr:hypothetical protein OG532_34815 [Streptomyces decoyicus]